MVSMKTAAIVGCGKPAPEAAGHKVGWGIAYAHAVGYLHAFPGVELCAVDPNAENLVAFGDRFEIPASRRFASTDAMYNALTPQCVSICTWPGLHVPQATDACRRGVKAIVVEKPIGLDIFEIQELISTSSHHGVRVAVAHQRRYEPWYERAKALIAEGTLGDNLVVEARVGDDWDMLSWTVHWFDMANYLFGQLPRSILAGVDHTGQRRYGHAVEDASVVFADYGPRRQGMFITGPAAVPASGIIVRGEKGMMQINPSIRLWTQEGYRELPCENKAFHSAFAALIADLWNARDGGRSRCDISECAPATAMAYAAQESARTMRRVSLPSTAWYPPLELLQHPPEQKENGLSCALKIALLADAHHDWDVNGYSMSGRSGVKDALEALGHRVTLLDATADLGADALAGADALVLYHTQVKTRQSHRDALTRWFSEKRPVIVSHCGIGAYADWPEFRKWIGRYWVWGGESLPPSRHPHISCRVVVEDPERFDVPWRDAWLPRDEMYQQLGDAAPTIPLTTATAADGSRQVYAWQVTEHPNVAVWLPGHRRDMFSLQVVRDGFAALLNLITQQKG
jgi:predicted dehydrogenase